MLSSGSIRQIIRSVTKLSRPPVVSRCMSSATHDDYHDHHGKSAVQIAKEHRSTLNDLPVPSGSWQEAHSKHNAQYNIILAAGIITFIATAILMKQSGSLYLHGQPNLKKVNIDPK